MEKLVAELKSIIKFKNTTDIGDVVLVAAQEPQMLLYAIIDSIERDTSKKDEWWHVGIHLLSVPPQKVTWTLRTAQMTGETFTMGGQGRFLQAVDLDLAKHEPVPPRSPENPKPKMGLKRVK